MASWVRYAATAHGLPTNGAYALIMVGQVRASPCHSMHLLTSEIDIWCYCTAHLPDSSSEIFGKLVQPKGEDDGYYGHVTW